jgi:uncharacterized protein (DUF849 family)
MNAAWTPLIVTVAPNGATKTGSDHPALPLTPAEIAHCAAACLEAGAAMIHVHVRDGGLRHSLDAESYRAVIAAIRREVGGALVIQVSTEAVGRYTPTEQMALVRELRPESASLSIRELIPDARAEAEAARFLAWIWNEGIIAQFILYSADDVARYHTLQHRGIVPPGAHLLLFVLGRHSAGQTSAPTDLLPFVLAHEGRSPWAMCAFGACEHACAIAAAALGGHVRVGFENNLYLKDGTRAPDNAALVAQVRDGAAALGRPLADADSIRALLSR